MDKLKYIHVHPNPDKAPRLWFHNKILIEFWHIIGQDVIHVFQSFCNRGYLLKSLNESHICLIPKGSIQETFSDFWPISLCNVIYKLISKSLAQKIKPFLDDLIFPSQCAFIKGRYISNNIIIASKIYHFMRATKSKKSYWAAVKIDFKNAFDSLKWDFIQQVLQVMNFPTLWITLVMECISPVSYKIIINGEQSQSFLPSRGLRQGDPISPYIFMLSVNVLSAMLHSSQ